MRLSRLCFPAFVLSLASCLPALATPITVGQPAPPLTFTHLLQAPDGTETDWPSLHGKVVVLEFWATWCAGCIENIPHLNELVKSIGQANIQFIAVDDEDPAPVKKFINKIPIEGWLGFDTTKKIVEAYDAEVRPRTVVIDTQGRIAAILNPEQLTRVQLFSLAQGNPVVFPTDTTAPLREQAIKDAQASLAVTNGAASFAGPKPLFDISVRAGDPKGKVSFISGAPKNDPSFRFDVTNAPLRMLFEVGGNVPHSRFTINRPSADTRYSLHIAAPSGELDQFAPMVQAAIASAAGYKITHVIEEQDAWVLQPTPQAAKLLSPSVSSHGSMCFHDAGSGKFLMVKSSLDTLASTLESYLGAPVVNEAPTPGEFDATFDLPKSDPDAVKAALETNLGLTLVKARRKSDRMVLDPLPTPPKSVLQATSGGKPVQTFAVPRPAP